MECPLNSNYNNNICHWILLSWTDLFFKQHIYLHFSIIRVWLAIIVIVLITVKVALPPTVWQMADKSSKQVSRTTPVSRSWQTYMHIHTQLSAHPHRNTHSQMVGIDQFKGDHSSEESVIVQAWQLLDSLSARQQARVINIYDDESWHPKGTLLPVITYVA